MPDDASSELDENELLLATLDMPTGERNSYLEKACQGNGQLQARVQLLLASADDSGTFMADPIVDLNATTSMDAIDVGSQIDRYRIMEQIGEGGMGVVFVAEQTEPVRRKVALKIIKPGMDSKAVIARFQAERQALALMEHPNIARVFDAGTTRERLPYFVMELVRGSPIHKFCDSRNLNHKERLELFLKVCAAVEHAHQKGIIHRDLKPSNILVSLQDDEPQPKVIDFGIAKATSQSLTANTVYTGYAQIVGTPLYMSPEQADLNNLDIDTRSDVYSLGIILYQLLTGSTPFNEDSLKRASFDEFRRMLREDEPEKPSERFSTLAAR